ncbi:Separin [Dufourea novaeangliae]|uniref:separase n=1 Tax=Dufourea novaeangliae TaxID=178035 RepID=A0A154PTF3_DUFNO|nr:Separin [Dufourea novaeangliae]
MENGCKIIKVRKDMGTCIVNPSGNLAKMEKRMKLFIDYWLPNWRSWYSVKPDEEVFEDALVNHDILMYNGHGNGIQYLPGEQIERLRVKSIVLLFENVPVEPEMLRAVAKSKDVCSQYMTAAAIVVRGLPIKLI